MGNTTFKQEFGIIVVSAVIFIASFLWKDLITDIEEAYFPKIKGIPGRLIYTIIVTGILIFVAINLRSILGISKKSSVEFDDSPIDEQEIDISDTGSEIDISDISAD